MHLCACHACGLVHRVGRVPARHRAACTRCGGTIRTGGHPRAPARAAALATAALLLYPAAMGLPIMTLTRMGHAHETTVWSGMVSLLAEGQVAVGLIVLFCSVVAPVVKLGAILALSAGELVLPRRHRGATYRLVEFLGRWGMLDVVLIALLVASVKLGDVVRVQPGPGIAAFAGVVVLSLLASAAFDPQTIWGPARGGSSGARGRADALGGGT
ncbi:MAG TPA: paraquat-inducible protein A [Phycisphaerales bacterium]|nr:paraquat-inducible protein A [Phycisphaerales bacterium]